MNTSGQDVSAKFRLATAEDAYLETYDHTKLSAMNVCPTWGILRYQMHKRMPGGGRAIALEAGSAMHECFAFIRMVSMMEHMTEAGKDNEFTGIVWNYHGNRLFGHERLETIGNAIQDADDVLDVCKRGCIAVLDTSGFYDDPRDKRRTLSNLEECIYAYINRWRFDHPVWIRDPSDPFSDVGIEIPFDTVVEITGNDSVRIAFRLTGRIDGIHYGSDGKLTVHDNKTASRLGEAWSMAQTINHQYTGYTVAASVFTNEQVRGVEVLGLAIPLPKSYDYGGYMREVMHRQDFHYTRWVKWLAHTVMLTRRYAEDPFDAPKYTHSCNRYFRPCSLIPFCDASDDEQHIIVSEMELDEWSPLGKPVLDGIGEE